MQTQSPQALFHSTLDYRIKAVHAESVFYPGDCMSQVFRAVSDCVCTCVFMRVCRCCCAFMSSRRKVASCSIIVVYYRPISNLPFLSKILEKVVLHKLLSHLLENNLSNPFQSAYRAGCSTETVLLRIVNDIPSALDNDNISVLLLDLSAAFDTLDHQILLSRLNSVFGIQSTALQWFHSYLPDRYQSTSVNNSSSSPSQLMYGVPQGSVLGPILFVLYTTPLSDIIANHSVNHQLFADDTQLQKSAPLNEVTNLTKELNVCTDNIKTWMTENQLKLNDGQNRSSSLSLFVFLETFYQSPPRLDYSWLSQHPLL